MNLKHILNKKKDFFKERAINVRKTYIARKEIKYTPTFGISLDALAVRDNKYIPTILEYLVTLLEEKGAIKEEGIFRISGVKYEIEKLKESIEDDPNVNLRVLPESQDINNIADLLKLWLRSLPQPLFPISIYNDIIDVTSLMSIEDKIIAIQSTINNVSVVHKNCIVYLMGFLNKISLNVSVNKMGPVNLATVIGPNIIFVEDIDVKKGDYFQQAAMQNATISFIIQEFPKIFTEPLKVEIIPNSFVVKEENIPLENQSFLISEEDISKYAQPEGIIIFT